MLSNAKVKRCATLVRISIDVASLLQQQVTISAEIFFCKDLCSWSLLAIWSCKTTISVATNFFTSMTNAPRFKTETIPISLPYLYLVKQSSWKFSCGTVTLLGLLNLLTSLPVTAYTLFNLLHISV